MKSRTPLRTVVEGVLRALLVAALLVCFISLLSGIRIVWEVITSGLRWWERLPELTFCLVVALELFLLSLGITTVLGSSSLKHPAAEQ